MVHPAKGPSPAFRPVAERFGIGWLTAALLVAPQLAPLAALAAPPPAAAKRSTLVPPAQRARVTYDTYLLGPGDSLQIELENIPELSGTFTIGPDGTLYLPRLRALFVDGLTIEELRYFLTQQFKPYIKNPEIYIRPLAYRQVRVYVGGEVNRPGYYTLSQAQAIQALSESNNKQYLSSSVNINSTSIEASRSTSYSPSANNAGATFNPYVVPTVYDAIRASEGVTPYSNLSDVFITRKQPLSSGGGKARASVNLLSMITHGDESQNARLFDGDILYVNKSPIVLLDQLLASARTNLNPQYLNVFITGRVKLPGNTVLPQGSSLNQALTSTGVQLLRGKVEFVRINRDGKLDRRLFNFNPSLPIDSASNPVLMSGDIIRVQDSGVSAATSLLSELTGPFVGIYSVYSLFGGIK